MADTPKLPTMRLAVFLDDGSTLEVQTANPDMVRWEKTRAQHRWPAWADAPVTALTFVAWSALRREQQIPADLTWEAFSETRCLGVANLEDDDDDESEDDPGSPTRPGQGPG